jgi:hypothetical protein
MPSSPPDLETGARSLTGRLPYLPIMGSGEEACGPILAPSGRIMLNDLSALQNAGSRVVNAIRDAATATGASFQYLLATAQVESGLSADASASSSSARGLFQFIDQTWLTTLKEAGPDLGYGQYANAITQLPSGRYEVSDPSMRQQILALKDDPTANAALAGAFTNNNSNLLSDRIGRTPTDGELYIAHFLGAAGAARLISLASVQPGATAADVFPSAARANKSIFYDRDGHARTVSQVYGVLVGRYETARTSSRVRGASDVAGATDTRTNATYSAAAVTRTAGATQVAGSPLVLATAMASSAYTAGSDATSSSDPVNIKPVGFSSLYSDSASGSASNMVQELWTSRPTVAAALTGQSAIVLPATTATGANTAGTNAAGGPLDLFSDHSRDPRGLFGVQS